MDNLTFSVPCLFGLEGLAANELRRLGLDGVQAENGRVLFRGGPEALVAANLWLRTGERVLLRLGAFPAESFDELFEGVRALPLEDFIPKNGAFPVKGHCLDSRLMSVPDCQRIVQKAAAKRLGQKYRMERLPADGAKFQLQFSIRKDNAEIYLDTTGAGLHKRGYRAVGNAAPLRETLAAAMVELARFRGRDLFLDPFCGSGTIVIEAALTAMNRAPGLNRRFAAEHYPWIRQSLWQQARRDAVEKEFHGAYQIFGSDIDEESLSIARSNAKKAGVAELISFARADALTRTLPAGGGVLVCNPPYGERLLERREAQALYRKLGRRLIPETAWGRYIISSEPEFERCFGKKADKKRKLYNGMIQCNLYIYQKTEDSRGNKSNQKKTV